MLSDSAFLESSHVPQSLSLCDFSRQVLLLLESVSRSNGQEYSTNNEGRGVVGHPAWRLSHAGQAKASISHNTALGQSPRDCWQSILVTSSLDSDFSLYLPSSPRWFKLYFSLQSCSQRYPEMFKHPSIRGSRSEDELVTTCGCLGTEAQAQRTYMALTA